MFVAMSIWGGSWVSGRVLMFEVPSSITVFWRFFLTAFSYVVILLFRKERFAIDKKSLFWVAICALCLTVYNFAFLEGLGLVPSGSAGMLVTTVNPLFALIFASLFRQKGLAGGQKWGLVLGLIGGLVQLGLLSWIGLGSGSSHEASAIFGGGTLILLGAAAVWAALTVCSIPAQERLSVFQYSFWLYAIATLFSLPFAVAVPQGMFDPSFYTTSFILNEIFLSFIVGTIATTIYFYGARTLGSARGSTFTFLVPVAAVLLGWLILNEVPDWQSFVGGGLSLCAVVLINVLANRTKKSV